MDLVAMSSMGKIFKKKHDELCIILTLDTQDILKAWANNYLFSHIYLLFY